MKKYQKLTEQQLLEARKHYHRKFGDADEIEAQRLINNFGTTCSDQLNDEDPVDHIPEAITHPYEK